MVEVRRQTNLAPINVSHDGKSLRKGIQKVGLGVIDVLDRDPQVPSLFPDDVGGQTAEPHHLLAGPKLGPPGRNGP